MEIVNKRVGMATRVATNTIDFKQNSFKRQRILYISILIKVQHSKKMHNYKDLHLIIGQNI